MMKTLRNILAFVLGLVAGSAANMLILQFGMYLIPPPSGFDMNTPEGLNAAFAVMEFKHFLTPFFSHAIGTLVGSFLVIKIAAGHQMTFAYALATLFFLGGLYMVIILNSPMWFNVVDLVLAYFPMAWLALRLQR